MKTILLTGATGFIGGHFLRAISQQSVYSNYNIILLSSRVIEGYKTVLHKDYTFTPNDFYEAGVSTIDSVIHIGAFIPKNASQSNVLQDNTSNISSVLHLINNLPNKPEKFIFFSTVDIYDSKIPEVITEESPTSPASLYGWSKLYGEKLLEAWAKSENITLQILRIGHIYGSGEEQYQKVIPVTIKKVLRKQKPVIFTKGNELRSFLHVTDCVKAVLASLYLNHYVGPINIVSGRAVTVKQIVSLIVNKIDPQLDIEIQGNDIPVRNLVFDNSKMKKYLGEEQVTFEDGLSEEIQNFRQ